MSNGLSGFDFFNSLVGHQRDAETSKDGKAITISGEIADGIEGNIIIRPSQSKGTAVDFEVGGGRIRHIEGR